MVTVRTQIGIVESARRIRVEETGHITQNNVQKALETLDTNITSALSGARTQRSITSSADLPVTVNDCILNVNISAPLTITVPDAANRSGRQIIIKDTGRTFASNNVTLNRTGSDTFDGLTTITLSVNGQEFALTPYNDGVNAGYLIG